MTALASAIRASADALVPATPKRRAVVKAGLVVVAGGSAVLLVRRSNLHSEPLSYSPSQTRDEGLLMLRRLQQRIERGRPDRRVDCERLQRLYQLQLKHPDPGPRETYAELIATLR